MTTLHAAKARALSGAGAACALAVAAAGVVHLALAPHHLVETPTVGFAFLAWGVAMLLAAQWLFLTAASHAWAASGILSLTAAVAYIASRVGAVRIGHHGDWDLLGMITTAVELVVAGVALGHLRVRMPRRATAAIAALMMALTGSAIVQATEDANPTGCVTPNKRMTLYAEQLPDDDGTRIGWGRTPGSASIPGPLIELIEGDCIAITVVNDVPRTTLEELWTEGYGKPPTEDDPIGISLHVHGVKYTASSDGTVQNDSWVPPGESRTYVWYAAPRVSVAGRVVSLGTAGYWWYHDHVAGTDHGTGGLAAGLFGGMIVRRPGDIKPDKTYTVVFGHDETINFKKYPETFQCEQNIPSNHCFVATMGERVEFLVLDVGDEFHTFHMHAHTWTDNRTGMMTSQADETRLVDVRTIGPSETFGFQVIAGEEVGPGIWMLHCHVQDHSDDGMATFFKVLAPGGVDLNPGVPSMAGHH